MAKVQNYIETDQEREEGHADTRHNNFECENSGLSPVPGRVRCYVRYVARFRRRERRLLEASSVPPYLPRLTR